MAARNVKEEIDSRDYVGILLKDICRSIERGR